MTGARPAGQGLETNRHCGWVGGGCELTSVSRGPEPMHSQQPPGVVQNRSTLQCSKQNTEQCGYDHAPVTRGRMRSQFPLPHGLCRSDGQGQSTIKSHLEWYRTGLRCSAARQNTELSGDDHAPVTRGRMRTQYPLPHGPCRSPPLVVPQGGVGDRHLVHPQFFVVAHCVVVWVTVLWGTATCIPCTHGGTSCLLSLKWNLAAQPCFPVSRMMIVT